MDNAILKYLRRVNARRTKRQIAEYLQFSYKTVSAHVNTLVAQGFLTTAGTIKTGLRGRPETFYKFEEN